MTSRILITGAGGFIGRHCLAPLVDSGAEVHAVGRSVPDRTSDAGAGVRWHRLDLLDDGARARLVEEVRPDMIVHFAWNVEHGRFWTTPQNLAWAGATLDMLRRAAETGLRRFVGLGTCYEYAPQTTDDCNEATTPIEPFKLYGTAKDGTRRIVAEFARETGLSWAWGRFFLLYGPGETPTRLVPQVARKLIAGEPAPIGAAARPRDFMDSRDAGAATAALALSAVEGPVNIASGRASSVREVAETLGRLAGRPELIQVGGYPDRDEPERIVADVGRLTGEVGFTAIRPLEQGLAEALDWWRENPS
ncbi:NAD(P)-dependent oxidoreductase [Microbaculum marinum]|uniref:NAD(P)-dependent oxidoreductase n=1 Tax=Microbaculum marinum TaxID=1764581 RepID=A0AAW9RRS1_9HYPH